MSYSSILRADMRSEGRDRLFRTMSVTVPYPIEVTVHPSKVNGLSIESAVRLNQIRSVDRERLVKRLGTLEPPVMRRVDEAIKISLGLVAL